MFDMERLDAHLRRRFDPSRLQRMAASIRERGGFSIPAGAVLDNLTRNTEVYAVTRTKRLAVVYSYPRYYMDEQGIWHEGSEKIEKLGEDLYGVVDNDPQVYFKLTRDGLEVSIESYGPGLYAAGAGHEGVKAGNKKKIMFAYRAAPPIRLEAVEGNEIRFASADGKTRFVFRYSGGLKELIEYDGVDDLEYVESLEGLDSPGEIGLQQPPMKIRYADVEGREREETITVQTMKNYNRGGARASRKTIPVSSLKDRDVSKPILIDPSVTIQPSLIDTYVYQYYPNNNYGTATELEMHGYSGYINHILLKFDLSSIPLNAMVEEATLYLYCTTVSQPKTTHERNAHKILASWGETTATWNNNPSHGPAVYTITTTTTGWHSWLVTSIVKEHVAQPSYNYGIKITPSGSWANSADWYKYRSRENSVVEQRPKLTVTYYLVSVPLPRSQPPPVKSTRYEYWLETPDKVIYRPGYMEAIQAESGIPVVNAYIPDPYGEHLAYFLRNYWCPIRVYAVHGGVKRKLLSGVVWNLSVHGSGRSRILQVMAAGKAVYLLKRVKNASYTNQDISTIIDALADSEVPEIQSKNYIHPTGQTISYGSYGLLYDDFNVLAKIALAKTGKEWRWYVCQHEHVGEDKENLHFEQVVRRFNPHVLSPDLCLSFNLRRSYDELYNMLKNVYATGSGGYTSVTVSDSTSQGYKWGVHEGIIYTDRFIVNDSTLATNYANAELVRMRYPGYDGYVLVPGNLSFSPAELLLFKGWRLDKRLVIRKVSHRFNEEGFTTMLVFEKPREYVGT